MRSAGLALLFLACAAAPAAGPTTSSESVAERPAQWAAPVQGHPHLPNLHQVTPSLYRGAQPDDAGFAELKNLGVKTVVNLRAFHSDRQMTEHAGLAYVHIESKAWHAEDEDVIEFLRVVTNPASGTVFVHCQHGADRTGTMVAVYRVVVQGWSKDQAVNEMIHGGFGFHPVWTNLVDYVQNLDVEAVRAALR